MSDISYHKLSTHKRCPKILDFWTIIPRSEQKDESRNAVAGSIVHGIMEDYLNKKVVLEAAYGQIPDRVAEFERTNTVTWRGSKDKHTQIGIIAQNLVRCEEFVRRYDIRPDNCVAECALEVPIGPFTLAGRIDVVQRLSNNRVRPFDWKATFNTDNIDVDQMRTYFLLLEGSGMISEAGTFLFTSLGKVVTIERDPESERSLAHSMGVVVERIKQKDLPAIPGNHCSWCAFEDICEDRARSKNSKQPEVKIIWPQTP